MEENKGSGKKYTDRYAVLNTIQAGIVRIDAADHRSMLWYNDKFLEMIDYTREQFKEETFDRCTYMHPCDLERAGTMASGLNKTGDNTVLEVRVYTRSKEERIWAVTLYYVGGEDSPDGIPSIYSMGLDLTAERKKAGLSEHIAEKDSLTGILNRSETEKQIEEYIQNFPDRQGALFMVDTDDFKLINDTKGHIVGDMVLAEMAGGMKRIMRGNDIVGRIGGDEFMIFMKDITCAGDGEKKAGDLIEMSHHLFEDEKSPVSVSCSIGVSIFPNDGNTFKELYANADKALYQVKEQGKNGFMLYRDIDADKWINHNYFSPRTVIESEGDFKHGTIGLLSYIFDMLYQSDDLDISINETLEIIGREFDVSRAYIFENSEDNLSTSNTYEWCNEGIESEIANLQNLSFQEHGNYDQLFGDDTIFYCRDIHTLKPEQEELFAMQGICSTLQCEILQDNAFAGMIGFDECTGLRLWTQEEISLLIMISQMISIFLQKKKSMTVNDSIVNYQNVLNNLEECVIVLDKASNELLYKNSKFSEHYPEIELGEKYQMHSGTLKKMSILWDSKEAFLCYMRQ